MHDPLVVHVGEGVGDLGAHLGGRRGRDGSPRSEASGQGGAVHQVEDDERVALVLTGVVHLHQAGMVQRRQHHHLGIEPRPIGRRAGSEHLDRDGSLQLAIVGLVHVGHAAPGDVADELVPAGQDGSDPERGDHGASLTGVTVPPARRGDTQAQGPGISIPPAHLTYRQIVAYNIADLFEHTVDSVADREVLVVGDAAPHLRRSSRRGPTSSPTT